MRQKVFLQYVTIFILVVCIVSIVCIVFYKQEQKKQLIPTNQVMRIKFGSNFFCLPETPKKRHHMQSMEQLFLYFLPQKYTYRIVTNSEKSDITIWDIHQEDISTMRDDECNIMICVENVDHWNMYKHFTKYGNYGNPNIHLYLYNHIHKIHRGEKYVAIPMFHNYIRYYKLYKSVLIPSVKTSFANKRFCLMINRSNLNPEIQELQTKLSIIGHVHNISEHTDIQSVSCYHSIEFLNVLNQYKFVLCYENSYKKGYITEKIFNCFFAQTIPMYKGAHDIADCINTNCFIDMRNKDYLHTIQSIKDDEVLYNSYIYAEKIAKHYDDENYEQVMTQWIEKHVEKNS